MFTYFLKLKIKKPGSCEAGFGKDGPNTRLRGVLYYWYYYLLCLYSYRIK